MAQDAISLNIKGMLEDGESIPVPSKLEDIMEDPDFTDAAVIIIVTVSDAKPRSVRNRYLFMEHFLSLPLSSTLQRFGILCGAFEKSVILSSW